MIVPKAQQLEDPDADRLQDATKEAFVRLQATNLTLGGVFKTVSVSTSDVAVQHGLRRLLNGWVVVGNNANAVVYESGTANPRPQDQIILKASASATVKLYFF